MPTISFPSNPSPNDTYTFGGKTWVYNGSAWDLQTQGAINGIVIGNVTPAAGTFTTISAANGIPTTTVANTAPADPEQGDIWIDSDTGTQLIYFTAGGNSQWAEMEAEQSFSSSGGGGDYSDSNVVSLMSSFGSNTISTTGNVTAGNVIVSGVVKFNDNTTQSTAAISAARSVALNMILG